MLKLSLDPDIFGGLALCSKKSESRAEEEDQP